MADRLDFRQVRAAAAMLGLDATELAAAVGRHPETLWILMRGQRKNGTASARLSADLTAYFTARGITFTKRGRTVAVSIDTEHPQP